MLREDVLLRCQVRRCACQAYSGFEHNKLAHCQIAALHDVRCITFLQLLSDQSAEINNHRYWHYTQSSCIVIWRAVRVIGPSWRILLDTYRCVQDETNLSISVLDVQASSDIQDIALLRQLDCSVVCLCETLIRTEESWWWWAAFKKCGKAFCAHSVELRTSGGGPGNLGEQ